MTETKIKVIFGKDIRRWHYPPKDRYNDLLAFVEKSFKLNASEYYLQFEDEEMDKLTISNSVDFEDAFNCADQEKRASLKIFVVKGSIENAQKLDESKEVTHESVKTDASNDKKPVVGKSETNEKNKDPNESKKGECDEGRKDVSWRKAALDFLTDDKIKRLLPELVRRIMTALRENENQREELSLILVMHKVLKDETFAPIVVHEFYQSRLKQAMPCLLGKISRYTHVLLNFSEESVGSWVPDLVNVITTALANEQDDNGEDTWDEMSPNLCHYFLPMWFSFMNAHGLQECGEKEESIHVGVQCDQCNVCPIRGIRYKCCVCSDFDLCHNCESFGKHNSSHPLIKMTRPMESLQPRESNDFAGIQEWYIKFMSRIASSHEWFGPTPPWAEHHEWMRHRPHPHHPFHPHPHPDPHSGWHPSDGHSFHHLSHGGEEEEEEEENGVDTGRKGGRNGRVKWMRFAKHMKDAMKHNKGHFDGEEVCKHKNESKKKKDRPMAELVKSVSIPDGSYYPVDTILQKTWEIKNTGSSEWGEDVKLVFVKGNASLPLEKEFSVPNAKPQESVKVSAMIRSPSVGGRFCSYFRLQKNETSFGPRVWVDFNSVAGSDQDKDGNDDENANANVNVNAKDNEKESDKQKQKQMKREQKEQAKLQNRREKLAKKMGKIDAKLSLAQGKEKDGADDDEILQKEGVISCMCGAPLIQTTPLAVYYSGTRVFCDICGLRCPSNGTMYHCPAEKTRDHPKGYDLCVNCVRLQMCSFDDEDEEQEQEQEHAHAQENQQQQVPPHQSDAVEEKDQKGAVQEKPKVVDEKNGSAQNDTKPVEDKVEDPLEGFEYQNEARSIMGMGFKDIEKIKYLLVNKKGDSNQVIVELLPQ